jgi:hypothetical protein
MVQINLVGLELNGTHQLLGYANNVNLMGKNKTIIKKNREVPSEANRENSLEVN